MPRVSRSSNRAVSDTGSSFEQRRARVRDLIASIRPLTARSVLATALLGADEPRLPVSHLVGAAALFAISPGAARTCLWRMVANGELTSDGGRYALAGNLLERRHRIDDAAHAGGASVRPWDGSWELAVVSLGRRPAADRLELRKATTALQLAEIREGVWIRPDNLDPARQPSAREVLERQCLHFRGARSDIDLDSVGSLFGLDAWARDAKRLIAALQAEREAPAADGGEETQAILRYQFALSIAVVRHLQRDPLLPAPLQPRDWPAATLRTTYRRFDQAFKRRMQRALRRPKD